MSEDLLFMEQPENGIPEENEQSQYSDPTPEQGQVEDGQAIDNRLEESMKYHQSQASKFQNELKQRDAEFQALQKELESIKTQVTTKEQPLQPPTPPRMLINDLGDPDVERFNREMNEYHLANNDYQDKVFSQKTQGFSEFQQKQQELLDAQQARNNTIIEFEKKGLERNKAELVYNWMADDKNWTFEAILGAFEASRGNPQIQQKLNQYNQNQQNIQTPPGIAPGKRVSQEDLDTEFTNTFFGGK